MGEKRVPSNFSAILTRVRHSVFIWRFRSNSIALQGTKILENREIRHRRSATTADTPRKRTFTRIVKYTGSSASPEWEDVEPGRVLSFPCYFVESTQSQKDKFETLCRVEADLSRAPLTSKLVGTGKMAYKRYYEIILLVGLTELKAQVGWVDSETVRAHPVLHVTVDLIRPSHI